MSRNPWVAAPRKSNEEMEKEIQAFLNKGGEIIAIPDDHGKIKPKDDTAVKIGKTYRQLDACKKNN